MSTTKNLLECYLNTGCVLYNILNTSFINCLVFVNHQKMVLNDLLCSTLRLVGKRRRRKKRRHGGSQRTGKPQLDHPSRKTPSPHTSPIPLFVEVSKRMRRGEERPGYFVDTFPKMKRNDQQSSQASHHSLQHFNKPMY